MAEQNMIAYGRLGIREDRGLVPYLSTTSASSPRAAAYDFVRDRLTTHRRLKVRHLRRPGPA
jgi:hypothetical protein